MSAPETILSVRDLSVAFHQGGNTSLAVDRVSFEIHRGEVVGAEIEGDEVLRHALLLGSDE